MLNTAADYAYNAANIAADGVVIQGRIIPTEDIDGLRHPLRRENLAYLCEAISERNGAAYWNVPAQNAGLHLAIPKDIWAHIADIYARNVPATTSMGSPGFVKPSYSFGDSVSTTDDRVLEAYSAALLSTSDLPAHMNWDYPPYDLYANDIRTMFYYMNLLHRKWMQEQIPQDASLRYVIGKNGGAIVYDGVEFDNYAPNPSTPLPVHDSVSISGFTDARLFVEGSVIGGSGNPVHYSESMFGYDLYDFAQAAIYAGLYFGGFESYYDGDVELKYEGKSQVCGISKPPLLFVEFHVSHISNGQGSASYLWRPISNATFVRDADDKVTSAKFHVDRAWLQSLVRVVFPSASFDYATVASGSSAVYSTYNVVVNEWKILEYPDYNSLLPSSWTWTPT